MPGEISEMMLDGFLDEETGEMIDGESPGYPRRMSDRVFQPKGRPHPVNRAMAKTRCPVCDRGLWGFAALAQHRAAKGH